MRATTFVHIVSRGGSLRTGRGQLSVRHVSVGGVAGLGGLAAGHGPAWIVATATLVVLAGALGAAELGTTAPLRRLVKLLLRRA